MSSRIPPLVLSLLLVAVIASAPLSAADEAARAATASAGTPASATTPSTDAPATATSSAPPQRRPTSVPAGVRWIRDVEFARTPQKPLLLDLYIPENATGPLPLILWIHGGSWVEGGKFPCEASWLSAHGYVVASISYRFSQEATFPAQIHDCKAALRWLRANAAKYQIDPTRVGAYGGSAGGHLAALMGTSGGIKELEGDVGGNLDQSSRVQAVCDSCGPADLTVMNNAPDDLPYYQKLAVSLTRRLLGGTPEQFLERARAASPVSYATDDDPSFLIIHGDADPLVPLSQSEGLDAALRKASVASTLHVVKGAGHDDFNTRPIKLMINAFFDKHLKGEPAAAAPAKPQTDNQ